MFGPTAAGQTCPGTLAPTIYIPDASPPPPGPPIPVVQTPLDVDGVPSEAIHTLKLYVATSNAFDAEQNATDGLVNVTYNVFGQWTDTDPLVTGPVAAGSTVSDFTHVRAMPTQVMITCFGDDEASDDEFDYTYGGLLNTWGFWKVHSIPRESLHSLFVKPV